jgi:hypothetical protein
LVLTNYSCLIVYFLSVIGRISGRVANPEGTTPSEGHPGVPMGDDQILNGVAVRRQADLSTSMSQ